MTIKHDDFLEWWRLISENHNRPDWLDWEEYFVNWLYKTAGLFLLDAENTQMVDLLYEAFQEGKIHGDDYPVLTIRMLEEK